MFFALLLPRTGGYAPSIHTDPLFAALDAALACPEAGHLPRADRLALALWWYVECVADELEMPLEQAADEVAMLCGLAKEMMGG